MTVLAYDPKTKTLALDSMFTNGDRKTFGRKFKVLDDGDRVVAFAGDVVLGRKAIRNIEKGKPITNEQIQCCTIAVFILRGPDAGTLWLYDDDVEPSKLRKPDAWGSGSDFAIGALAAGADAERAVQITCDHSASCGGKVRVFRPEV